MKELLTELFARDTANKINENEKRAKQALYHAQFEELGKIIDQWLDPLKKAGFLHKEDDFNFRKRYVLRPGDSRTIILVLVKEEDLSHYLFTIFSDGFFRERKVRAEGSSQKPSWKWIQTFQTRNDVEINYQSDLSEKSFGEFLTEVVKNILKT